jgi:hypothetical protein
MSILLLCEELRRSPLSLISEESAFSLCGFFAGYSFANSSIIVPLKKVADHFPNSDEMAVCTRAYLASADPKASFDRLLAVLEHELKTTGEPPAMDVRTGSPLLDAILDSVVQCRTGVFLREPTVMCVYETLNGYWCGMEEFDQSEAQRQRSTMNRFTSWLRSRHRHTSAPWYALLRVYEGPAGYGLDGLCRLYNMFSQDDAAQ